MNHFTGHGGSQLPYEVFSEMDFSSELTITSSIQLLPYSLLRHWGPLASYENWISEDTLDPEMYDVVL